MIRDEINELLLKDPFEPFRVKLVNGDYYDVFDPQSLAVQKRTALFAPPDLNWASFPLDKVNSLESLIADYQGKLGDYEAGLGG